jgi:predicted nucleotidyltransferase
MTNTETLEQITRRIVEGFHPQRLILFGSRARGNERPDSDVDLLIVAPSDQPRWRRAVPVYRALAGVGVPKDIVWWTPEEIAEWRGVKTHFINTVLREGIVLYENLA